MKNNILISAILSVFLCFSCHIDKNELYADDTQLGRIQGKLGDSITLKKGDTVVFISQNFSIIFNRIVSDSRCPKGVACVWAGAAEGEFKFIKNAKEVRFNLGSTGHPSVPSVVHADDYIIKLVDYIPYPDVNQKSPGDPSARFVVSEQP